MASIPNNIVAKDSGGNIKKVNFEDVLEEYAKTEDVQNIVLENLSDCIKSVDMSFAEARRNANSLDIPFLVDGIKLYTAGYGSEAIIYSTQFPAGPKELQKTTDAWRFVIESPATQFGVASTKKCFLIMSFDGYDQFSSNVVYTENECREAGAHGGNPILLDWKNVVLQEGASSTFSCMDQARKIGVFGRIDLLRRTGYSGNIHTYSFRLEFTICGIHAWKNFKEGNRLTLETTDTAERVETHVADLNSVAYPKIASIGATGQEELQLAFDAPSKLSFNGENGVSIRVENADEENASLDEKRIHVGFNAESLAGSGIVCSNGKLNVPAFTPASGSVDAISGLVPGADASKYDDILTVSGWKSFEEIGLNSALKPFAGATAEEDGDMGFVPKPFTADKNSFLKGDGTWSPAVESVDGDFSCELSLIDQKFNFGFCFCDLNGRWMFKPKSETVSLHPEESVEGTIEFNYDVATICGISLSSPWQAAGPASVENNANGWTADKTFWKDDKSRVFSAIFPDGSSMDVWIEEVQDEDALDVFRTRFHYRINGFKTAHQREILVSVDGVEQTLNCSLAQGESESFNLAGNEIRVWPASSKTRILHEKPELHVSDLEEQDESFIVPWGGRYWVNSERTAMLKWNRLAYLGDLEHSVQAAVSYARHEDGDPVLVYGLEPSEEFWDIILQEEIEYSGEALTTDEAIGHVWIENGAVKAASKLFANWSVRATLLESDEPIVVPSSSTDEEIPQYSWIPVGTDSVHISSIGLELSRTDSGIRVYAPLVDLSTWPRKADSLELHLDCGIMESTIELECLTSWLNARFSEFDRTLAEMEQEIKLVGAVFTGATRYADGLPGLVPSASFEDRNKYLMGDGTWVELTLPSDYVGATPNAAGIHGLVPAATSAERSNYFRGDGTWFPAYVVTTTMPTNASEGDIFFYIED